MSGFHTCPSCNGCGEIVNIFITHDSQGNEITHQQATYCTTCGGDGQVAD